MGSSRSRRIIRRPTYKLRGAVPATSKHSSFYPPPDNPAIVPDDPPLVNQGPTGFGISVVDPGPNADLLRIAQDMPDYRRAIPGTVPLEQNWLSAYDSLPVFGHKFQSRTNFPFVLAATNGTLVASYTVPQGYRAVLRNVAFMVDMQQKVSDSAIYDVYGNYLLNDNVSTNHPLLLTIDVNGTVDPGFALVIVDVADDVPCYVIAEESAIINVTITFAPVSGGRTLNSGDIELRGDLLLSTGRLLPVETTAPDAYPVTGIVPK